ncbi:MAG: Ig domain-containing protein [Colwellia sp.]|nr:Ig domain-containing protein [Colwellia sp.]
MNIQRTILAFLLLVLTLSTSACGGGEKKSNDDTATGVDVTISDKPITNAVDGQAYTYRADFGDWNNNTDVTFTIKNKPDWLSFNEKKGVISGIAKSFINIHKNVEYVYFDIEIIATLNGQVKSTKPFNIVITNEAGKIVTKHIVFSATYADSETSINQADIDKHYNSVAAYVNYLSNGKHQVKFDVVHLAPMTVSREKMRTISLSQTALNYVYLENAADLSRNCDLTVMMPLARIWYDENKEGQSVSAEPDFSFTEKFGDTNTCQSFFIGTLATHYLNIPENINIDDYHSMIFTFYDDEIWHQPFASNFDQGFNVKQGDKGLDGYHYATTNMNDDDFNEALYLDIDSTDRTWAELEILRDNPKIMSEFYTQAQVALTSSEKSTAHEIFHLLGVLNHDDGLTRYGLDNSIFKTLEANLQQGYWGAVNYGDLFSIMGSKAFSIGLAPSSRELLGWVDSNNIHTIDSSSEAVIINDMYSTQGATLAKVKVEGGYLYLSYHAGNSYDESLKHPLLVEHSQGIQIHYTDERTPEKMSEYPTSSTLLDPDEDLFNDNYALKAGESYTIFNVEITTVSVDGVQAIFDVKYIN